MFMTLFMVLFQYWILQLFHVSYHLDIGYLHVVMEGLGGNKLL